jgi:hypothetical protein
MELIQKYSIIQIDETNEDSFKNEPLFTQDEEVIKKHYGDTNYGITSFSCERVGRFENNIFTLKVNFYVKKRRIGKKYFSKRFKSELLKFDLNKGNFLIVNSNGSSKKRRDGKFSTNVIKNLLDFLEPQLISNFWSLRALPVEVSMSNMEMGTFITSVFGGDWSTNYIDVINRIFHKFCEVKKLKLPDVNGEGLLTCFYPTEKFFKKNDRKVVQSVLDMMGMKDKFTIKLLHKYPYLDLISLKLLYNLFGGTRYLSNLNNEIFEKLNNRGLWFQTSNYNKYLIPQNIDFNLLDVEKSNLIKVLNKRLTVDIQYLIDHFSMINKIRKYDSTVYMTSTTPWTMDEEHYRLSEMVSQIKKGYRISYEFDLKMVGDIETPITIDGVSYYPYILKSEAEYNEEGNFMKHCVATYYNKDKSVIISIRNEDASDRVTCEYEVKFGGNVQSKYFKNQDPPDRYKEVIRIISRKCSMWALSEKLKCTKQIKTPLTINGVQVKVEKEEIDLPF